MMKEIGETALKKYRQIQQGPMSSITRNSETVTSSQSQVRPSSWRLGMTGWILILGLIALNVGVLFESIEWNKRTIGWLPYRIDPRYWPLWPVPILWGIVIWMLNDTLRNRFNLIQRKQCWIKTGIVLGVLCWTAWLAGWTFLYLRRKIYYRLYVGYVLYVSYIMGPIAIYYTNRTLSWKLLIVPTLAVIAIVFLLSIAHQERKKRHESKSGIKKFVEFHK